MWMVEVDAVVLEILVMETLAKLPRLELATLEVAMADQSSTSPPRVGTSTLEVPFSQRHPAHRRSGPQIFGLSAFERKASGFQNPED